MTDSSTQTRPPGGLSRMWQRFTRTQSQMEAEELLREHAAEQTSAERIDCCTPGETVTIRGMVRSVTLRPRSTVPALEIELYDGSGAVSVIWLGRRRIPGIDPGRTMEVTGRLTGAADHPTIYNPRYELKPVSG